MSYNIIRHKVSDAVNDSEEPLKENKEKIDIEALVKQNEELLEENTNLTVCIKLYIFMALVKN